MSTVHSEHEGQEPEMRLPAAASELPPSLVVPSIARMEVLLAEARDAGTLADLERAAAALQEVAKRHEALKSQLAQIAAWHLRVRRKLGSILMQTVHRGGDRAKLREATLPGGSLPRQVDKFSSRRCQLLARIPEAVFDEYLDRNIAEGRVSTLTGALRLAKQPAHPGSRKRPSRRTALGPIPLGLLDPIGRVSGDLDVCVGEVQVPCRRRIAYKQLRPGDLVGSVLLAGCPDPGEWTRRIEAIRQSGAVEQASIVLERSLESRWFREAVLAGWAVGLRPEAEGWMVLHIGRAEAFRVAMLESGGFALRA